MRKLLPLLVAGCVSVGALVGLAGIATGAVDAKTPKQSKFCRASQGFDTKTLGDPTSKSGASATLRELKKLRRVATGQAKTALGSVITAYEDVAGGSSARKVFAKVKVVESLSQLSLAVSLCATVNIPGVTLPTTLPSTTAPRR
jgi:hypothetical protein